MSSTSPQQIAANQANAQHSTGPRSAEGKKRSSVNARRTGLTGRTVLISEGEADLYADHCRRIADESKPVGDKELDLVQELADTKWRIGSIPGLEYGYYAMGREEFADLYSDYEPEVRRHLIEVHTHRHYEKIIRNLNLQEARLHRAAERFEAQLREMQRIRREREALLAKVAAHAAKLAAECATQGESPAPVPSQPSPNGFVFSTLPVAAAPPQPQARL